MLIIYKPAFPQKIREEGTEVSILSSSTWKQMKLFFSHSSVHTLKNPGIYIKDIYNVKKKLSHRTASLTNQSYYIEGSVG